MKFYLGLALSFFLVPFSHLAQGFEKGILNDTVVLRNVVQESFALYLPQSFEQESPSGVIFIFDPVARGKVGIEPFIEAAEIYNLILVCSNNSRNAAYERNFEIAQHWFDDILARFHIDPNRIYAAGFSGGSRLASAIGVLSGAFKGVIGCGASFSGNPGQVPYSNDHFYYYGLVGNLDMNYQEMLKARQWLDRINLPNHIKTFEGEHRWPDHKDITSAFHWFRLQDINKKLHPKEEKFLESYLSSQLALAYEAMKNYKLIEATDKYEYILNNFQQHFELDSISTKIRQLKKTKEYKKALKEKLRITTLENEWTEKLTGRVRLELERETLPDHFKWWQKELASLHEDYINADDPLLKEMGIRLRSMIAAVAIENLELAVLQGNQKEINYYALLMDANWPDTAYMQFRIAKANAAIGKNDKALLHLNRAVSNGWKNKTWIKRDKAFESLSHMQEFQLILEKM